MKLSSNYINSCLISVHQIILHLKEWLTVFPISRFLVNPLKARIIITPEPVMILTWNLYQSLNMRRETQKHHEKEHSKKLTMKSCRQTVASFSFFWFRGNLEQSQCRIVMVLFLPKNAEFLKKSLTVPKLRGSWY